ncbi:MAG: TVP38/TMEM64 family protein [Rhodopila sp.]
MRRFVPLLLLLTAAGVALVLGRGVGWESLVRHQAALAHWIAAHPIAAPLLYLAAYILVAALSLPQAVMVTVAGGLLFGTVPGAILTIIGATTGAAILVAAARTAFSVLLDRHRKRIPEAVRTRLAQDGFLYLLALRLLPVVPFWLVNLAAAVVGIRLRVFVPATLVGIAPATFVFSSIGAGAGGLLANGGMPDLSALLGPQILLPLLGLAALSLLPALLRRNTG